MKKNNLESQDTAGQIAFIKDIIEQSRQNSMESGKYFILWGILMGVATLSNYFIITLKLDKSVSPNWFWLISILIGIMISIFFEFQERKKEKTSPLPVKIYNAVWSALGITITIVALGIVTSTGSYYYVFPLLTAMLGLGYYITSKIYDLIFFRFLAYAWWISTILIFSISTKSSYILLVIGLMFIFFQAIPGLILHFKFKNK